MNFVVVAVVVVVVVVRILPLSDDKIRHDDYYGTERIAGCART